MVLVNSIEDTKFGWGEPDVLYSGFLSSVRARYLGLEKASRLTRL